MFWASNYTTRFRFGALIWSLFRTVSISDFRYFRTISPDKTKYCTIRSVMRRHLGPNPLGAELGLIEANGNREPRQGFIVVQSWKKAAAGSSSVQR